jgi:hypothetical protein
VSRRRHDNDDDIARRWRLRQPALPQRRNGRFTDATAEAEVAGGRSSSAAFLDYDRDGRLDLFVGRYMEWSFGFNPHCSAAYNPFPEQSPAGPRAYCHPNLFKGKAALLYRNEGGGRFRDVSWSGVANPGASAGRGDRRLDGDGFTDIFGQRRGEQFLYRNRGTAASRTGLEAFFA